MIRTRLVLVNRQNVTVTQNANVAIFENIPASITYQIADIRFPEKRTGSNTKTVNIPGTQEVNLFFQNAYQANISLSTFNPKKKVDAIYYVNELVNFKGYLRLMKIVVNNVTGAVVYQCVIVGEVVNIFKDIENLYLTDLDFTSHPTLANYSHTLNKTSVVNSWALGPGSGYVYPLIDWGFDNSNFNFCNIKNLKACLFAYDYLLRIFIAAGYTWTSTFLDSTFFKRLIIPPTETQELSSSVLANNSFGAEATAAQAATSNTFISTGFPLLGLTGATAYTDVQFQTEVYDTGAIFATPNFTPTTTNKYIVTANIGINIVFKKNGVADNPANYTALQGALEVIMSGGVSGSMVIPTTQLSFSASNSNNFTISLPNVLVNAASNTKISWRWINNTVFSTVSAGSGADTWTVETDVVAGSNFSAEFASKQIYDGAAVDPQTLIPSDVKQGDFFSWIIRMFNLYVTVDKSNSRNLIIEPRPTFYSTTSRNWENLHDESKDDEVIPLGEFDFFKATYSYSPDGDYFNKLHEEEMKEVYGYEEQTILNDFNARNSDTVVGFAPTPYMSVPNLPSMVVPSIITKENNAVAPFKPKIRILYWSGTISLPTSQWTLVANAGNTVYTTYPHAGHFDNPYAPTIDLNWGYPSQLYYNFPNLQVTNNNLYNKYYSKYINQISDKNSKIVQAWFKLSPYEISIFDFRKPIFYDQAYWLVNKIINYNPLVRQSTQVELLKLTAYDEFTPSIVAWNGGGNKDSSYSQARTAGDSITKGDSNTNLGNASMIMGGSGNYISPNAETIVLLNCTNVVVNSDVEFFVGSNLSNMTIDSTYSNSELKGSDVQGVIDTDADIDRTDHKKILLVSAIAGDVTLTVDTYNMDYTEFTIVRTDASPNSIFIDSTNIYGTENFNGNAMPFDLGLSQYDSKVLKVASDTIRISSDYSTTGGGGGGGTTVNTITGTTSFSFSSEEDSVVNTIASAVLTSTNIKAVMIYPVSNSGTSLDDFKLAGITFSIENIINTTSFDIRASAINNATGTFDINYKILYF
jgi:hypothetical protein